MNIVAAGTVERISSRLDGTICVTLGANEMESADVGRLFDLRGKFVKFLLSNANITPLQSEAVSSVALAAPGGKTPSQQLRSDLFILHRESGTEQDFDSFYKSRIEGFRQSVKEEIKQYNP